MNWHIAVLALSCVLGACNPTPPVRPATAGTATQLASASPNVPQVTLVVRESLADTPGFEARLYVLEYPAGALAALHAYTEQCVGYVLAGRLQSAPGALPATTFDPGQAFSVPAREAYNLRNLDSTRSLRIVVAGAFHPEEPLFRVLPGTASFASPPAAPIASALTTPAAEPLSEPKRTLLLQKELAELPGMESRLYLAEFPPAAQSKLHVHPVTSVGYVLEGSFESAFGADPVTRRHAGDGFVDLASQPHHFKNADAAHTLRFLMAGTFHVGDPLFRLVDADSAPVQRVELRSTTNMIKVAQPALYPETVELNPLTGNFLLGSFREGTVYEGGLHGPFKQLLHDDRLISVLGIAADPKTKRLLVTNSDLGLALRHSARGARKEAAVGSYDLTSGRALDYVDLAPLTPDADHLINGITVDAAGNAYATDSFAPVIYQITSNGHASVLLRDDEFRGPGVNLNGIVAHSRGFLLAVMKSTGALYRIPLQDPRRFSKITLTGSCAAGAPGTDCPANLVGGDGLSLVQDDTLVVIANRTPGLVSNRAFVLKSADDWATATIVTSLKLEDAYPTTSALFDGKLYVLSSHLDEWLGSTEQSRTPLTRQARTAELLEIGAVLR